MPVGSEGGAAGVAEGITDPPGLVGWGSDGDGFGALDLSGPVSRGAGAVGGPGPWVEEPLTGRPGVTPEGGGDAMAFNITPRAGS